MCHNKTRGWSCFHHWIPCACGITGSLGHSVSRVFWSHHAAVVLGKENLWWDAAKGEAKPCPLCPQGRVLLLSENPKTFNVCLLDFVLPHLKPQQPWGCVWDPSVTLLCQKGQKPWKTTPAQTKQSGLAL